MFVFINTSFHLVHALFVLFSFWIFIISNALKIFLPKTRYLSIHQTIYIDQDRQ
ncbi:MAG: hypothetical protein WCG25_00845 [bacterium]